MNKVIKIGLIVAGGFVGLVFLVGIGAAIAIPNANRFIRKSRQSEAKVGLTTAATSLKMVNIESGSFDDDVALAFPDPEFFTCKESPCRHYIYAIQRNCESGNGWNIVESSKLNLHPPTASHEVDVIAKIQALQLPCKSKQAGFTIVAAGVLDEGQAIDVWAIEETDGVKSLEDSLAK